MAVKAVTPLAVLSLCPEKTAFVLVTESKALNAVVMNATVICFVFLACVLEKSSFSIDKFLSVLYNRFNC